MAAMPLFHRSTALWLSALVISAVLALAFMNYTSSFLSSRGATGGSGVTAPLPQIPHPNLRIDLVLEAVENGKLQPLQGYDLGTVLITSLEIGTMPPPPWHGWIGTKPLNAPAVTDKSGSTTLWFKVDPPPHVAGVRFGRGGSAPVVGLYDLASDPHWRIKDEEREMLAPDHWRIRVRLGGAGSKGGDLRRD